MTPKDLEEKIEKAAKSTANYLYNIEGEVSPEMYQAIARLRQLINEEYKPQKSVSSQLIYDILISTIDQERDKAVRDFITKGWGKRCETKDTDDFPEMKDDPLANRCATCEMWEHYDELNERNEG